VLKQRVRERSVRRHPRWVGWYLKMKSLSCGFHYVHRKVTVKYLGNQNANYFLLRLCDPSEIFHASWRMIKRAETAIQFRKHKMPCSTSNSRRQSFLSGMITSVSFSRINIDNILHKKIDCQFSVLIIASYIKHSHRFWQSVTILFYLLSQIDTLIY